MAGGLPMAILLAGPPSAAMTPLFEPEELPPLLWLCRQPTPPDSRALSTALAKAREEGEEGGLETRDRGGHTALWWACYHGHSDAVETLVQAGADPAVRSFSGRNLLMAATAGCEGQGAARVIDWLVQRGLGGGLEDRSGAGYTALWWACFDGRVDAAEALLRCGADEQAVDVNGESCVQAARGRGYGKVVAAIQESSRAYVLSKARRLAEAGRASGVSAGEAVEGEVAAWVVDAMDGALFVELMACFRGEHWSRGRRAEGRRPGG